MCTYIQDIPERLFILNNSLSDPYFLVKARIDFYFFSIYIKIPNYFYISVMLIQPSSQLSVDCNFIFLIVPRGCLSLRSIINLSVKYFFSHRHIDFMLLWMTLSCCHSFLNYLNIYLT